MQSLELVKSSELIMVFRISKIHTNADFTFSNNMGEDIDISSIDFNMSVGYTYIEINSISNYMTIFIDNEIKYSGKCRVGSNIPKGVYVVNEMLENTNIPDNNYVSRYIGFDNTFFISDASWEILGEYNEDCISVPVKDIRRASYWAFINMPIIIY